MYILNLRVECLSFHPSSELELIFQWKVEQVVVLLFTCSTVKISAGKPNTLNDQNIFKIDQTLQFLIYVWKLPCYRLCIYSSCYNCRVLSHVQKRLMGLSKWKCFSNVQTNKWAGRGDRAWAAMVTMTRSAEGSWIRGTAHRITQQTQRQAGSIQEWQMLGFFFISNEN